jgi:phosphate transport system ATP-binding protein
MKKRQKSELTAERGSLNDISVQKTSGSAETPGFEQTDGGLRQSGTEKSRPIISVNGVDLFYSDFQALKNINLAIDPNEITAFIGPSGCGKTTLLKCFNRMNDLVEGCKVKGGIIIDGKDVYRKDTDVNILRKEVGMVFQKPNVFPMSIYDNIAFGPRTHGIRKRKDLDPLVADSLKKAGIFEEVKDTLNKSAMSLSGGQQQRICIARALAVQPKILLMDEPTSALDPISTGIIEELCEELKEQYTIVIVTHNMQQATRISDKTAFFLLGEMLEFGETEQIFSNPKNEKCERYITGRFG